MSSVLSFTRGARFARLGRSLWNFWPAVPAGLHISIIPHFRPQKPTFPENGRCWGERFAANPRNHWAKKFFKIFSKVSQMGGAARDPFPRALGRRVVRSFPASARAARAFTCNCACAGVCGRAWKARGRTFASRQRALTGARVRCAGASAFSGGFAGARTLALEGSGAPARRAPARARLLAFARRIESSRDGGGRECTAMQFGGE